MKTTPYTPTHQEAGDALAASYRAYIEALDRLSAIEQCPQAWPADPPGPGYPGTRCDLLAGHQGRCRTRIAGSSVVVSWP